MASDWARWIVGTILILAAGAFFLYREFDNITHQVKGYSFSETLPKTIDAEGGDSRVVSVLDRDKNVFFAVLTDDGDVVEHFYGEVCQSHANGPSCAYRETEEAHPASPRETKAAKARLDELDPDVVKQLRSDSGAGKEVPIGLRGRHWVVGSFDAGVAAIADLDGSNLHPAKTPREIALAKSVASDSGR